MNANIQNGGLVLQADDRLLLTDIKGGTGAYMLRIHTDEPAQVISPGLLWDMNVDGEAVYYSDQRRRHAVFRLELGTLREELIMSKPCCQLQLRGDWLYYIEESSQRLYRRRLDGREEQAVAEEKVWGYVWAEGRLYYSTPRGIKCGDSDGSYHELITDAAGFQLLHVGGRLVFPDQKRQDTLTLMDTDGSHSVALDGIQTASLNTDGEYVYCANALNNRSIYRVDTASGRSIRISGDSADYLHVAGDSLYYCHDREWYRLPLAGGEATRIVL